MLEIRNESGIILELPSEQRVTIEIISPLFSDDDVLAGSRSLQINVLLTENNQAFFQGKYHYYTDSFADMKVSISVFSQIRYNCTLSYRYRQGKLEAYLKIDIGEIANKLKKLKLKDLIIDQIYIGQTATGRNSSLKFLAESPPNKYPITFFPVKNDSFFEKDYEVQHDGLVFIPNPYVNWWDRISQTFVSDGTLGFSLPPPFNQKIIGLPIVPFVYVRYTIEKVCNYLGLKAVGQWLDEYETMRAVWDNNVSVFSDYLPTSEDVLFNTTIEIKNYVPDITLADFFKALRSFFGLGIFVDITFRQVVFKTVRALREEEIYTSVGFAPSDKMTIEEEISQGITVENAIDSDPIYKTLSPRENFVIGEGEKKVSLKIGTLPMVWESNPGDVSYRWVLPTTQVQGNVSGSLYKTSENYYNVFQNAAPPNKCPLRILIYHGLQPDSGGALYPYASSISINYEAERLSKYALWPDEADNIFEYLQRPYFEMLESARTITSQHVMSITEVANIRPETKIAGRLDGLTLARFYLKQLSYAVSNQESDALLVELKLVPLKPLRVAPSAINDSTQANIYVELLFLGNDMEPVLDESLPCDVWAKFWTTPARSNDQSVTNLALILRIEGYDSQYGLAAANDQTFICNGIETKLLDNISRYQEYIDLGITYFSRTTFSIMPTSSYRVL